MIRESSRYTWPDNLVVPFLHSISPLIEIISPTKGSMIMESPNLMEKNTLSGNLVDLFVRDGGALGDTD